LKVAASEKLVFVDETGIDRYLYRDYARAPIGQKVYARISGKKYKRTNIVAGICDGRWVSPLMYSGTTDSTLFEHWFENRLMQEVAAGSIIVLDNATFHRKRKLQEIAVSFGCEVWFLPPYSPDLNPIEKWWAWLKRKLREVLHRFQSLDDAICNLFQVR